MSDRICRKCDGRGFERSKNKAIITALTDIERCATCGGFGRVKDFNWAWIIFPAIVVFFPVFWLVVLK